jgi:hypothetical protein
MKVILIYFNLVSNKTIGINAMVNIIRKDERSAMMYIIFRLRKGGRPSVSATVPLPLVATSGHES